MTYIANVATCRVHMHGCAALQGRKLDLVPVPANTVLIDFLVPCGACLLPAPQPLPAHGTVARYKTLPSRPGCRCQRCRDAHAARRRTARQAERAAVIDWQREVQSMTRVALGLGA